MLSILIVSRTLDSLDDFNSALTAAEDLEWSWAESGAQALHMARDKTYDLVVAGEEVGDMTALQLAAKLLPINAVTNCAVVSDLPPEEFREASEGLGLMCQLPLKPGREQAEALVLKLKRLKNLETGLPEKDS
jgi:hypothetical protein